MSSTRVHESSKLGVTGRGASVWITGDQLLANHPALAAAEGEYGRDGLTVVLVETTARRHRFRYQRRKLVLVLSAMRHYALELKRSGYNVDYHHAPTLAAGLNSHLKLANPEKVYMMAASEFAARSFQSVRFQSIVKDSGVTKLGYAGETIITLPNTQFLTGQFNPYPTPSTGKRVMMENFYREMRRHFGILLETDGKPIGGKWNYDEENRKPLPAKLILPESDGWEPDAITWEVIEELETAGVGIGNARGFNLAVTRNQALEALDQFISQRLNQFGPYEDAMASRSGTLFHSVLSPYLNIGLLEPLEVIRAAERAYHLGQAPINSVEGFIRQVLGWREFVYWQYWQMMPDLATANHWQVSRPLPDLFWSAKTDMNCLRQVTSRVLEEGYSHHIERLMVLCNFCLLAGINPAEVADWFNSVYVDAFDWVVLPNVIGMGLNADGGRIATKPYIASANYINKMSDYCRGCRYNPKERTGSSACPFNYLYWNFLIEHEQKLRSNPRLGPAVLGLSRVSQKERELISAEAKEFLAQL